VAAPSILTEGTKRIVAHQTYFEKQAPFTFNIENQSLQGIQQQDFEIKIKVSGTEIPNAAYIEIDNNQYRLEKKDKLHFVYLIRNLPKSINFRLFADGFYSKPYELKALPNPTLVNFTINLVYPAYLQKKSDQLNNTGDLVIPAGTKVQWLIKTENTNRLTADFNGEVEELKQVNENEFSITKTFTKNARKYLLKKQRCTQLQHRGGSRFISYCNSGREAR
jgi:hypothetical protein